MRRELDCDNHHLVQRSFVVQRMPRIALWVGLCELIGRLSDARAAATTHSFDPILITAGLAPFAGMVLTLLLGFGILREIRPCFLPPRNAFE